MATLSVDPAVEAFASSYTESEVLSCLKNLTQRGRRRLATHGHIAISIALEFNKEPNGVVKAFLDQPEIQVNSSDLAGNTPLHNAVLAQNQEVVGMLLARADLDPNVGNVTTGDTPLHLAVAGSCPEMLDLLLSDRRVHVAALNKEKQSPLHAACKLRSRGSDATHVVVTLVNSAREKLKSVSDFLQKTDVLGRNAMHHAAESGLGGAVSELLQMRDLALMHDNTGSQAVHLATRRGHLQVVQLLLQFGRGREDDVVRECLQAKCSLDPKLCATLHLAEELLVLTRHPHIAEYLLAALYTEVQQSASLFHWAVTVQDWRGHGARLIPHILKWQPERANAPLDDFERSTALHVAVIAGNHDAAGALCRTVHLDGTRRDVDNKTPLDHAFDLKDRVVCRILLERPDVKEHLQRKHKNRETYTVASPALLVVSVLVVTLTHANCLTASEVKKRRAEGTLVTEFRLPYVVIITNVAFFLSMASTIFAAFAALPFSFGIFFVQTVDDRYVSRSLSRTRVLMVIASNLLMLALGAVVFSFVCSQYIAPFINYQCELACEIVMGLYLMMSVAFLSPNVFYFVKERRAKQARIRTPKTLGSSPV